MSSLVCKKVFVIKVVLFCFVLWNFASQGAAKVDLRCSQAAPLLWGCAGTPGIDQGDVHVASSGSPGSLRTPKCYVTLMTAICTHNTQLHCFGKFPVSPNQGFSDAPYVFLGKYSQGDSFDISLPL